MSSQEVTLLLVEDDDVDAMGIERGFKKHRIANSIVRARDGLEALDLLKNKQVPEPYIILLDLNMPRMGGIEFLNKVRENAELSHSVIFVLTTSNEDTDVAQSYDKHIAGYFLKSETGEGFKNIVDLLDGYWKVVHLPTGSLLD